jgi:prolyl 4-hydroxylase
MKDYQIIENLLSPERCQELINISETQGYEEADISYPNGARMNKEYRDNSRCLYQSEELRLELEKLLEPYTPKETTFIREGGVVEKLEFLRLSGKFRFYKYKPGEKFKKHRDGNVLEEGGLALYTVLLYLNTPEEGGETKVFDYSVPEQVLVKAEAGKVLIFNHIVPHTGEELKQGVKYVLRTDFIYKVPFSEEKQQQYEEWLTLREESKDEHGKLCYCGHTHKCECADPDLKLFTESVDNGTIKLGDKENGWKKI